MAKIWLPEKQMPRKRRVAVSTRIRQKNSKKIRPARKQRIK